MRKRAIARAFFLTLVSASVARADTTFTVNTEVDAPDRSGFDGICETDDGDCSLRAAIMQANGLTGPRTTHIVLPAGNYKLVIPALFSDDSVGDLNLKSPLSPDQFISIEGDSAATSVIDADQIDRVMTIDRDRVVTMSNVTISGGFLTSTSGGGIKLDGSLILRDSIVSENSSGRGGGIFVSSSGHLDVVSTIFISNVAAISGGAAHVEGTATFSQTSMSGNGSAQGGAVAVIQAESGFSGAATFSESRLVGNFSEDGGAIYVTTKLEITNSTISGNAVSRDGGGIANFGQTFIVNSTISGNTANANGGGIANQDGASWLYNTSIIGNDASHDRNPPGGSGGGVYNKPGKRLVATNSLIAGNTTLDAPIADDCNGVLEVYGWNLLADFTGCSFSGSGISARGLVSTNTIGPLVNNGGATMTHALLAGSEAIDTTTAQGCIGPTLALLATDQRGAARIAGAKCDVGAYEYGSVIPPADVIYRDGFE